MLCQDLDAGPMPSKDSDKQATIGALAADVGQTKTISGDIVTVSTAELHTAKRSTKTVARCMQPVSFPASLPPSLLSVVRTASELLLSFTC